MIVGNGDIASVLVDREDVCFFASGVSNSQETRESEYKREEELLLTQNKDLRLVYFSSLAVFLNPDTRYAKHKRHMEELIKKTFPTTPFFELETYLGALILILLLTTLSKRN